MQRFKLTPQSTIFSSFKDAKGNATFYRKRKARIIHLSNIFKPLYSAVAKSVQR